MNGRVGRNIGSPTPGAAKAPGSVAARAAERHLGRQFQTSTNAAAP